MYNILSPPITARFVRLLPVEWHNHISIRMEIYGCAGTLQSFGSFKNPKEYVDGGMALTISPYNDATWSNYTGHENKGNGHQI